MSQLHDVILSKAIACISAGVGGAEIISFVPQNGIPQ
jgi:hypothetical protein